MPSILLTTFERNSFSDANSKSLRSTTGEGVEVDIFIVSNSTPQKIGAMAFKTRSCTHLDRISEVKTGGDVCAQCATMGGQWVHLRCCQSCGKTLCCDSSPHRHAAAHFAESGHAVISSAEAEEQWLWCYEDELFKKY